MRRDVLGRLLRVTQLVNEDMERGLAPLGLTMARSHVLWELGERPGMTQRQLATRLGVTPRNVTALIDALEALGLVDRQPHPADRRAIALGLTATGAETYRQFRAGKDSFAVALFDGVAEDRLNTLADLLGDIVARLEELAAPKA